MEQVLGTGTSTVGGGVLMLIILKLIDKVGVTKKVQPQTKEKVMAGVCKTEVKLIVITELDKKLGVLYEKIDKGFSRLHQRIDEVVKDNK